MTTDHENGVAEKLHKAEAKLADKLEPTEEELEKSYRGAGGPNGESEAIVQKPTAG